MSDLLLWSITLILLFVGLLGIFIPALPGILLVFAGILFFAAATGFSVITPPVLIIFGSVALVACLAEYAGSVVATRVGGGGRWALLGCVIGGLVGMAGGPPGFIIGALLGAYVGALYEGREALAAGKIALWSLLGLVGAKLLQFVLAIVMILAFLGIVLI